MSNFFMDMETLGIKENSVILSIAVLSVPDDYKFNGDLNNVRNFGNVFYPNLKEQRSLGRKVDKETVEWWSKQSNEAKKVFSNKNMMSCSDIYKTIKNFFDKNNFTENDIIWSRGLFEQKLWADFCDTLQVNNFIPYYSWRDTRTVCDIFTGNSKANLDNYEGLVVHNALDDCILDYIRLENILLSR